MVHPRKLFTLPLYAALLSFACLLMAGARAETRAQQPVAPAPDNRELGIALYKRGDTKGAITALRAAVKQDKEDADAWYYLSLALNKERDFKGARKAVERVIKLRPDFAPARTGMAYMLLLSNKLKDAMREAERALALGSQDPETYYVISVVHLRQVELAKALKAIDMALIYKPDFAAGHLWKSQVLFSIYAEKTDFVENESAEARAERTKSSSDVLRQVAESLEKYFQLNPSPPNAAVWREQLENLRVYARNAKQDASNSEKDVFAPKEVMTKARILSRKEPQYTEDARQAQVSGTVILRAVFASDGTVRNILVVRSLPHGLTEEAVKAARKIKFVPAIKDGRSVSQFVQIEYNYNLY